MIFAFFMLLLLALVFVDSTGKWQTLAYWAFMTSLVAAITLMWLMDHDRL